PNILGRLHLKKDNSIYALAAFNICCDIFQLILHVCYIGPSVITGKWFFEGDDSLGVTIIATFFMGQWFLGSLMQILFATNSTNSRFVVICIPRSAFFSLSRVIIFITICCCIATVTTVYTQLLSPCCRVIPDPRYFGYSYLVFPNQIINYSYYIELTFDAFVSTYGGISYIALFMYVLKMGAPNDTVGKREMR
ncbi:hypothetical protein ANCCAN_08048, partial [Ancylostoma caninum]